MTKRDLELWEQYKEELNEKNEKFLKDTLSSIKKQREIVQDEYNSSESVTERYRHSIRLDLLAKDFHSALSSTKKPTIEGFYDWLSENKEKLTDK